MPDLAELDLIVKSQQVKEASKRLDELKDSGKGAEEQAKKTERAHEELENKLISVAKHVLEVVSGYEGLKMAMELVERAAAQNQQQIIFEKLLGSATAAKRVLVEIRELSDKSTLDFGMLQESAKHLAALGVAAGDIPETLRALGEAASVLGQDKLPTLIQAFGKLEAGGRLTQREMMLILSTGIPAWEILARTLGVDVATAMEKVDRGIITGKEAMTAFLTEFDKRFGGSMLALHESTAGSIDALKDNVQLLMTEIGKGLIDAFDLDHTMRPVVEFSERYRGVLGDIVRVLGGLNPKVAETASAVQLMSGALKPFLNFVAILVAAKVAMGLLTAAVWAFNFAVKANPILFILAAAAASIIYLSDQMGKFEGSTTDAGESVVSTWQGIRKSIIDAENALAGYLGLEKDWLSGKGGVLDQFKPIQVDPNQDPNVAMGLKPAPAGSAAGPWADPNWRSPVTGKTISEMEQDRQQLMSQLKQERAKRMGDNGAADSSYLPRSREFRLMQEDLDHQLQTLGLTNDQREVEAARLRISRLELRGVDDQTKHYLETLQKLQEAKKLEAVAAGIGDAFTQAFDDAILSAKSFGDVIKSLMQDIERAVIHNLVTQPAGQGISSFFAHMLGLSGSPAGEFGPGGGGSLPGGTPDNITGEFASGGVVNSPTFFPMGNGMGVAGEAGPEAIMPLARDSSGKMGVRGGGSIYINLYAQDYNSFRQSKGQLANDLLHIVSRRR